LFCFVFVLCFWSKLQILIFSTIFSFFVCQYVFSCFFSICLVFGSLFLIEFGTLTCLWICFHHFWLFMVVPAGRPGSSLCAACPNELGHLRSASFVSTWKKKNKGAPSRPFALRRSSQLARNTKVTRDCMIISMTGTVLP